LRKSNPKLFYGKFGRSRKFSTKVSGSEFFDHFKSVASTIHSNMGNSNIEESGEAVYEELDQIISNEEIVYAISNLKRCKSHGIDGLLNEYFIEFQDLLLPVLYKLFNGILTSGIFFEFIVNYSFNTCFQER
jgi:hypothetical protein